MEHIEKDNTTILALTLYGEARGEICKVGILSLQAVGMVVVNRLKNGGFGKCVEEVCLQPYQFSCWNQHDLNFDILISYEVVKDPVFQVCYHTATNILHEKIISDFTQGATHYHARSINPYWTKNMRLTLLLGNHMFYKNEG